MPLRPTVEVSLFPEETREKYAKKALRNHDVKKKGDGHAPGEPQVSAEHHSWRAWD